MRRLLFTKGHPPYNVGEEATFPDAQAGALVSRGVADYVDAAPPVAVQDDEPGDADPDDPDAIERNAQELDTKAPAKPPADKMVRSHHAIRKKD